VVQGGRWWQRQAEAIRSPLPQSDRSALNGSWTRASHPRVVYTPERFPAGCTAGVRISAIQVEDGSFETAAKAPHVYLDGHPDSGLTIEYARALALILTESAAQLESWIEMLGAVADPGADR